MAVTFLTQATAGAPVFNGSAGKLISLLDFCLVTKAGWAKSYSGTNLATYRPPSGNRFYLGVSDTVVTNARVRGFESTDQAGVAIGANAVGPFPTDVQVSGGGYVYKSADTTTARDWMFTSDGTCFHLAWVTGVGTYNAIFFGDFISSKEVDGFNTALFCDKATTDLGALYPALVTSIATADTGGHYIARAHTGLNGSVVSNLSSNAFLSAGATALGKSGLAFPSPIDGTLVLCPVYISEMASGIRGYVPGLWNPMHARAIPDDSRVTGAGDFAGKEFYSRWLQGTGSALYEITDTWGA